jgi:hypothetical protein
MIFSRLIIHNHDRTSSESITRILHTATWDYFTARLPDRFTLSPRVVQEAIMTDINDLVQEFCRTSSDEAVASGESFFAMLRLLDILQLCFDMLEVCFDIISVFATAVDLANKTYRCWQIQQASVPFRGTISPSRTLTTESEPNLIQCWMGIERCLISHFPKIWVT